MIDVNEELTNEGFIRTAGKQCLWYKKIEKGNRVILLFCDNRSSKPNFYAYEGGDRYMDSEDVRAIPFVKSLLLRISAIKTKRLDEFAP